MSFFFPLIVFQKSYQPIEMAATSEQNDSHKVSLRSASTTLRSASMSVPLSPGELGHAPNAGQIRAQRQPTRVGHMSALDIYSPPAGERRSSIICTIGPSTASVEALGKLMDAGMNIVRLNFSHGSYEYHGNVIKNTRLANAERPSKYIGIALDTKGPEIRTGVLADSTQDALLEQGSTVIITTDKEKLNACSASLIFVDYERIAEKISVGGSIFIDDGLLNLLIEEVVSPTEIRCTAQNSGYLGSRKGVNLPDCNVDLPALSEKDKADLLWGIEQGVDMIFASFIRKPQDVLDIRALLGEKGKDIQIISKIENHEGVRNFTEILAVTDGVMVARGDLGIEIPVEKVFIAQKMMIARCNVAGKPVICATQMLESMTYNPRPTRAEVSDVANAVLDGSDCVMLSGETAKGKYPFGAVKIMDQICREAESAVHYAPLFGELKQLTPHPLETPETIASAAVSCANENHASAIIVLTKTGSSARLVSKYRPACPIVTVTRNEHTARISHLYRGCYPCVVNDPEGDVWQGDVDSRIFQGILFGRKRGLVNPGDLLVVIQGWRQGSGFSNTIRILVVPSDEELGLENAAQAIP